VSNLKQRHLDELLSNREQQLLLRRREEELSAIIATFNAIEAEQAKAMEAAAKVAAARVPEDAP
jgi:N-acetylglutamate synthase-like GNAT family acetyltransferase